jgi:hypothetical protein
MSIPILLHHQNQKSTSLNFSGMVNCLEMTSKVSHKWEMHGTNQTQTPLLHPLLPLILQLIQLLTLTRTTHWLLTFHQLNHLLMHLLHLVAVAQNWNCWENLLSSTDHAHDAYPNDLGRIPLHQILTPK